jgi:hypothetical protein
MLIYGGLDYGTQGQSNENNVNLYPVPQNPEPVVQPNMPGNKNTDYQPQPQPQPQPQMNIDLNKNDYNNQNQTQNYPQQENNQGYQSTDINNQQVPNPFEGQGQIDYNQNIPQPKQENIPIPDVNIPQQNEPYP